MDTIHVKKTNYIIYHDKLRNGTDVFLFPNDKVNDFYISVTFKAGNMDTEYRIKGNKKSVKLPNGTAHFLEHKMFDLGEDKSAFQIFSNMGSSINAYTSFNNTTYEVTGFSDFKNNLLEILNFTENANFTKESVQKEKDIIKEEINMYNDIPESALNFKYEEIININDKHKYKVSGNLEDIDKITYEDLQTFYKDFYRPNNKFIVVTGNFKPLEALAIIKNRDTKSYKQNKVIKKSFIEPLEISSKDVSLNKDKTVSKIKLGYKIDKRNLRIYSDSELQAYLDAILHLKFCETSDFYENVSTQNLLFNISVDTQIREQYISIAFNCDCEYKTEIVELIKNELKNLKVSKNEFERVKKVLISNFFLQMNNSLESASLIINEILINNSINENLLIKIENMDFKVANNILKKINFDNYVVVSI